jgi:hypothetical protein
LVWVLQHNFHGPRARQRAGLVFKQLDNDLVAAVLYPSSLNILLDGIAFIAASDFTPL